MTRLRTVFETDFCTICKKGTEQRREELSDGTRISECFNCHDIDIIRVPEAAGVSQLSEAAGVSQ